MARRARLARRRHPAGDAGDRLGRRPRQAARRPRRQVQPEQPGGQGRPAQGDVILGLQRQDRRQACTICRGWWRTPRPASRADVTVWRDQRHADAARSRSPSSKPEQVAADDEPAGIASQRRCRRSVEGARRDAGRLTPETSPAARHLPETINGVVVTDVDGDGPAAEQGLRPGDIIEQVGSEAGGNARRRSATWPRPPAPKTGTPSSCSSTARATSSSWRSRWRSRSTDKLMPTRAGSRGEPARLLFGASRYFCRCTDAELCHTICHSRESGNPGTCTSLPGPRLSRGRQLRVK